MVIVKTFAFIATLFFSFFTLSQHGGVMNHWYFGWLSAMEFTTGSPEASTRSMMICEEGSATCSDADGNLLFYTNGGGSPGNPWPGGVWNRNHELMPNGTITGLTGSDSSPQSSLVLQKTATQYYLFTIGSLQSNEGLRVSIVDMTLDNGLGDLILVGSPILDNGSLSLSEGLTATRHANGTDYWLVVHSRYGNTFYLFQVTPTAIIGPTIQNIGMGADNLGQIKFSVQGNRLAQDRNLFDFNNATGLISNPVDLGQGAWGRAFSASGRYFYTGQLGPQGDIHQYDLTVANIPASQTLVGSSGLNPLGPFQIGPDRRIYMPIYGQSSLAAINNPEMPGLLCGFASVQVNLNSSCQLSVPNFVDSDLKPVTSASVVFQQPGIEQVFPNPTTDFLFLNQVLPNEKLQVYSLDGKSVANWTIEGNRLDVRKLVAGIYLLKYGESSLRFVKQ